MSLGILSSVNRPLSGYASIIPGECWDQAGFKDCHTKQFAQAQKDCQAGGYDLNSPDSCVNPHADTLTMSNCTCKKKTTTPKPVVISSPKPGDDSLEPAQATLFGMDMKSVAVVGLVAVGAYLYMNRTKG